MISINSKRQRFVQQIRKKRRQDFINKQRSQLIQNNQNTNNQQTFKLFREQLPPIQQKQELKKCLYHLEQLNQFKLKLLTQLCLKWLNSSNQRNQILKALTQVTHKKNYKKQILLFESSFKSKIIQILKSTKDTDQKINCIYIYGNLIVDVGFKDEEDFRLARQILNIINKQQERTSIKQNKKQTDLENVLENLLWVMKNTILIFIQSNKKFVTFLEEEQQLQCKKKQCQYGQYCLVIICQMLDKHIRQLSSEKMYNQLQISKIKFIQSWLQLFELIISHKVYNNSNGILYFDGLLKRWYQKGNNRFNEQFQMNMKVINISIFMIEQIGFSQGVQKIIYKICEKQFKAQNVLRLISFLNRLQVSKLHKLNSSKRMQLYQLGKTIENINFKLFQIIKEEIGNKYTILNRYNRIDLLDFLLSYNNNTADSKRVQNIWNNIDNRMLIELIQLSLIDQDNDTILKGLKVLSARVQDIFEQNNFDSNKLSQMASQQLQRLKNLVLESDVGNLLLKLQMNQNEDVHKKVSEILEALNIQE